MNNFKTEQEYLEACIKICEEMKEAVGKQCIVDNNIYQEDLYFWLPTVKRTISLVEGYQTSINFNNYYTAIHLIRLVLDSGLRFAALWFVNDRREFFTYINEGNEIRTFKDNENKKLTDARLVERLNQLYNDKHSGQTDIVKILYKDLCSIIHLNDQHIPMLKDQNDPDKKRIAIGDNGNVLSDEDKTKAANNLFGALIIVNNVCKSWEQERTERKKHL